MFRSMLAIIVVVVLVPNSGIAGHINRGEGHGPSVELAVVVDSLDQVIGPALDVGIFSAKVVFRMDDGRVTVLELNNRFDVDPHTQTIFGSFGDTGPK